MNVFTAAGNIGQDPRHNSVNGKDGPVSVLNFSLGITEHSGGEKSTLWVDCALWGRRADALQPYLSKGSKVTVQGPISVDSYEKNGEVVPKLKLNVREITLQGGGQQSGQGQAPAGGGDLDDVPF